MANAMDADGLTTFVEVDSPCAAGGPVVVRFTVRNPTTANRTFCDYHTPMEGVRNDIFIIRRDDGSEVDYGGMMAKRAAPGPDNYIRLQPGDERTAEVNIADDYDLPPGRYTIAFRGSGICGLPDSDAVALEIS